MEDKIKSIIRLNIELEGALRVAADRKSDEALEAAREKFAEMTAIFASLQPAPESKADARLTGVKEDEALNGEESPSPEPTLDEIPADGKIVESDADAADVAVEETQPEKPAHEPLQRPDIRKAFTLNDKFLFRRELFGGNDAEFNDTLDLLESMGSLHEAEEYLYDDLQWDAENDTVRDFMNIITGYFSQHSR